MPIAVTDLAAVAAAVVLAAIGGEAFLKAILGVAQRLRVPKAVVATTLAAFATSSPELTVSAVAALAGQPEIGLGDALGSNVVNIALIFGLALLFGAIPAARKDFGFDFALGLAAPLLTMVAVLDGKIERSEGVVLLLVFSIWLIFTLQKALRHRHSAFNAVTAESIAVSNIGPLATLAMGAAGLGALIAAGKLFVFGASGVAASFEIDPYVVGALIVAIGTSLPELVTVLISRLRGHDEVGIGTLIGSNLFNGLAIVGIAATIHPIVAPTAETAMTLLCGILALLLLLPNRSGMISRLRGGLLLGVYGGFVIATLGLGKQLMEHI